MNRTIKLYVVILCFLLAGCSIYRDKYYAPLKYIDDERTYSTLYHLEDFENWVILIDLGAYYHSRGIDFENNYFSLCISASTFDKKQYEYKDTNYKAQINYMKVLHGDNLKKEIAILKTKYYDRGIMQDTRSVSLCSEYESLLILSDIESLTVMSEIEFTDRNNQKTVKNLFMPMKRIESWSIGPTLD